LPSSAGLKIALPASKQIQLRRKRLPRKHKVAQAS